MTKVLLGWVLCALALPLQGSVHVHVGGSAAEGGSWRGADCAGEGAAHFDRSRGVDRAMEVEVFEVLKGSARGRRLRIWGDDGAQCRPYVSGFTVGTEWIFAVNRLRGGDYVISVCGEYWA